MKTYIIYFEIFNKKMKCEILAESEAKAKEKLYDKIIIHKIVEAVNYMDKIDEDLDKILNIIKNTPRK